MLTQPRIDENAIRLTLAENEKAMAYPIPVEVHIIAVVRDKVLCDKKPSAEVLKLLSVEDDNSFDFTLVSSDFIDVFYRRSGGAE